MAPCIHCFVFPFFPAKTGPYSEYKISVKAFTWKNEGDACDAISQRTDISGPSPPIVVNLTCHVQDALYLRWKRPLEYYNSIDFYIISFRSVAQKEFQEIQFNASAAHLETAVSEWLSIRFHSVRDWFGVRVVWPALESINFFAPNSF